MERSEVRFGTTRIAYTVARTRRQKTVAITIGERGDVELRAPEGVPVAQLDRIVHGKARWIVERRRHVAELEPRPGARDFVSGESFFYAGRQYRLRVSDAGAAAGTGAGVGAAAAAGVRLERGWLVAAVERGLRGAERARRVRSLLVAWYRGHAERRLPERVATWAPRVDVEPAAVLVREQRKRWGSCDARGVVRLNWRIVQASSRLVDYVIAHELVHVIERDHTRAFWARLGQVMPDYDARRNELRQLGRYLVW